MLFRSATTSIQLPPNFERSRYNPAILHIRFTEDSLDEKTGSQSDQASSKANIFLDLILTPAKGESVGRRAAISKQTFTENLRDLYRQLSRQDPLRVHDPSSASRQLYNFLIKPIEPFLHDQQITTLLISADRGLQAVPFAALHNGQSFFGDTFAFSITPSLALTSLDPPQPRQGKLLAVGSAVFDGLAPLPLVPTELDHIGNKGRKDKALNRDFTPQTLLTQALNPDYSRVHIATHAEFLPGGPAASRLYSGTMPIALSNFKNLRLGRENNPLDRKSTRLNSSHSSVSRMPSSA